MANIVDAIGFDLERVHTGLIVYLVDLWRSGKKEPLQTFFSDLGVELQETEEVKAEKERENIDLVLFSQNDKPLVAVEMKVHNYESLIPVKGSRGEKAYQTEEYPRRIDECPFLYVTLGVGEYYRREPYGDANRNVKQVGLDEFISAVKNVSDHDSIIKAWEESLVAEKDFREARGADRKSDEENIKKWNLCFLGFLREELDESDLCQADLTAYRHSQDTILNSGITKPAEVDDAYCYIEINGNGKLNLKANLESLDNQPDKQAYVERARNHYTSRISDQFSYEKTGARANLTKSRTIISFDVGIEKAEGYFGYTESRGRSCKRISEILQWFSTQPVVKVN